MTAPLSLPDFLVRFPEFRSVDYSLLASKLDEAALELDPLVWGKMLPAGVGYLAAHKLALSPFGQNARLSDPDKATTYEKHFEALVKKIPAGFRVP